MDTQATVEVRVAAARVDVRETTNAGNGDDGE
jgi:hypothetical protein